MLIQVIVVEEKQDTTPAGPGKDSVIDIEAELDLGLTEAITQDDQEDEADVLLFADTLLACLDKRKVKGKENFKWDGKIQELKDFVQLVLDKQGRWNGRKQKGK